MGDERKSWHPGPLVGLILDYLRCKKGYLRKRRAADAGFRCSDVDVLGIAVLRETDVDLYRRRQILFYEYPVHVGN